MNNEYLSSCYIKGTLIWLIEWIKIAFLFCFAFIFWLGLISFFVIVGSLAITPQLFQSTDATNALIGIIVIFVLPLALSFFCTLDCMPYWKDHLPVFLPKHIFGKFERSTRTDRYARFRICTICGNIEAQEAQKDDEQSVYVLGLNDNIAKGSRRLAIIAKVFFYFLFGYVVTTEMALFYGAMLFDHNVYWASGQIYDMGPEFFVIMLTSPIASGVFGSIIFLLLFLVPAESERCSRLYLTTALSCVFAQGIFLEIAVFFFMEQDLYHQLQNWMGVRFNFKQLNFWFTGFSPIIGATGGFLISFLFWEQPTRLRILEGESPSTVSFPKRTVSISAAQGGNELRYARK